MDLEKNLRKILDFNENYALSQSYANCQSTPLQKQIMSLSQEDQTTWFAGHHNGFNAGAKAESARLTSVRDALCKVVAALEWYDNVHRNHWAIDLNDLEKTADEALTPLRKVLGVPREV